MPRTIGVVTVARSDYGIYLPVLRRIAADPELSLKLFVGGMHLSPEFGLTIREIEKDGFAISHRVEMLVSSDSPQGIAKSMGMGVMGFAQAYAQTRPDLLLVLGDRFEMHSAVLAALPFKIPVAHLHGGEVTRGAIDDALRHCITKLSHLHFVATEEYGRRVRQLGEEPWRVIVSGAPGLENLQTVPVMSMPELEQSIGFKLEPGCVLATFHPVTLEYEQAEFQCNQMLLALHELDAQVIFTLPNADTAGRLIAALIKGYAAAHPRAHLVENLGTSRYFNLMRHAGVMIGNSSSGVIEAPSLDLPVVNIGTRQDGRVRAGNLIDVGNDAKEILAAMKRALHPDFRKSFQGQPNPCASKTVATTVIVDRLKSVSLNDALLVKTFYDLPA